MSLGRSSRPGLAPDVRIHRGVVEWLGGVLDMLGEPFKAVIFSPLLGYLSLAVAKYVDEMVSQ
jgi:hypothetical protein